ncbi:MAG: chemotaxis protein CheW, partial [Burkholderiaceae bacterium]
VINLRGVIVPVVDLRQRFGAPSAVIDGFTVVIVLHLGTRTVGIVVDSVSDVLQLAGEQIRPAPQVSCAIDAAYITGLGSIAERTLILLDIQALLNSPEMGLIDIALPGVH